MSVFLILTVKKTYLFIFIDTKGILEIKVLGSGTSQGVPIIGCQCKVCQSKDWHDHRLRSSVFVAHKGKQFVIDTGPDFRYQMLRSQTTHLDFILLTHIHKDHTGGLDDIRAFNFLQKQSIDVFANQQTCENLKLEFSYAFEEEPYPGAPKIQLKTIENKSFETNGITILPIQLLHLKLPIFGYRIDNFAYITDASYIAKAELDKLKGLDLLILNALRIEKHYSHFNLKEALQVVDYVQPKQTYFTHISHNMGLYKDVEPTLPPNCHLAYDGLTLHI